jgi:hypothetical protein
MAKAAFIILRVITAIATLGAFAATIMVLLVTAAIELLKGGAHATLAVAKLFASGFRDAGPTPSPPANHLPAMLAGLAIFFLTMFISVFTPGQKIFLHIVAGMAIIATAGRIWFIATTPDHSALYLPVIAIWFVYYALCLRRASIRNLYIPPPPPPPIID